MAVVPGRMTAKIDGDFVVFLIGMRINKPWKLHKWFPVTRAMGPMIAALSKHKDAGLLGWTAWIGPSGPMLVQYWRSVEQLEAFARDPQWTHHKAWRSYNTKIGASGDVGVWHESYQVRDGAYEALYANMPATGLARASAHAPVPTGRGAAGRRSVNATVS